MSFKRTNLIGFLSNNHTFQLQASFEFHYPFLFDKNSFLIDQLNVPKIDTNIGQVYIDGFQIPVHSTPKFDNEISFTMYVPERFLDDDNLYHNIFNKLMNKDIYNRLDITTKNDYSDKPLNNYSNKPLVADIIPLQSNINPNKESDINTKFVSFSENEKLNQMRLYNALIKSCSFEGGFSSNSIALLKFQIEMTYSLMKIEPYI